MDNKHNSLNLAAKICSDICPRTLSVPRSERFSESEALRKLEGVQETVDRKIFTFHENFFSYCTLTASPVFMFFSSSNINFNITFGHS